MRISRKCLIPLVGLVALGACSEAFADITLGATNRGWIRGAGAFASNAGLSTSNYFVGNNEGNATKFRDWFVFDLTGVVTPIASAELLLHAMDVISDEGFETYIVTSTTTTPAMTSPLPMRQ